MITSDNSNLDFLRATAVLFVLAAHLTYFFGIVSLGSFNLLPLGYWGVLVFFVHTSLVLMLSLERQWSQSGGDHLFARFMVRRCFRILPLSIIVVTLITAFRLPQQTLNPGYFVAATPTPWELLYNLVLIQNLAKVGSILGPLWSLPYEMQMYLCLPWLFLFLRPARSSWRSVLMWVLSIGCAAIAVHHLRRIPDLVLFVPCFLPGVIAYQLQRKERHRLPAFLWPVAVVAVTMFDLVGSTWAVRTDTRWAIRWAACVILGLAVPRFLQLSARWLVVPSHWIAQYSYGIYLTHFFAIWLAFERLGHLPKIVRVLVFVFSAVGLPILFYHLAEEPMIRIGKRLAGRWSASLTSRAHTDPRSETFIPARDS